MLEINEKFKNLLSPLSKPSFRELEASILKDGLRTPIQVWNNQIVDGHNRYEICRKYKRPYKIEELSFPDEDSVYVWILQNQLGRRNITPQDQIVYMGRLYRLRKKLAGAPINNKNAANAEILLPIETKNENNEDIVSTLNSETLNTTAQIMAAEHGVSERTVRRAEKIADAFELVDDETKRNFLKGQISQKDLTNIVKAEKNELIIEATYECLAGKNAETEYMSVQANHLKDLTKNFKKKFDEVIGAKIPKDIIPEPLARLYEQGEVFFLNFINICDDVKEQFVCNYCKAKDCENCTGGYVSAQKYCLQTKNDNK